jgi:hypothetical protein
MVFYPELMGTNIAREVTLRHSKGKRKGHCPHASSA